MIFVIKQNTRINGEEVEKKSLAKALKRKIGFDEDILSKIQGKRGEVSLLMNPTRRKIFEYVCNFPASHLRAISRGTGYSTQTVKWHLGKLVEGGLLSRKNFGIKKIYSPLKNILNAEESELLALMNDEEIKKVYLYIKDHPLKTQKDLCNNLGMYQQSLSRILLILEKSDLLIYKKKGREKKYLSTNKFEDLVEAFDKRSSFWQNTLLAALEADSLNPQLESSDSPSLIIKLDVGGGKYSILKVPKNPFAVILGEGLKNTKP